MPTHGRERRLHLRVTDVPVHIEYVAPSPHIRDLSLSGCYIQDLRTLHLGQQLQLRIRLDNAEPILISGMVRRVDAGVGMAVEFIHIEPDDRRRLKDYLAKAAPESISPAGKDIFE
jgi:hypothetical protein